MLYPLSYRGTTRVILPGVNACQSARGTAYRSEPMRCDSNRHVKWPLSLQLQVISRSSGTIRVREKHVRIPLGVLCNGRPKRLLQRPAYLPGTECVSGGPYGRHMRKPTKHTAKNGTVSWKVRYRDSSKTFYGPSAKKDAEEFAGLCASIGPDEAVAYLRKRYAVESGVRAAAPTLDEYAARYIETRTGITAGTRHGYERTHALYFGAEIGTIPLDLLTYDHVAKALNDLRASGGRSGTGLADKTLANAHGLLSAMLKVAVGDDAVPISANPCDQIKLGTTTSHEQVEMYLFDETEFETIVNSAPVHYRPLIIALGGTGMRWGEAEALTVGDVNVDSKTLRINKAAKWNTSKSQREVGPPKTKKSNRTVTLPDVVVEVLRPLLDGRPKRDRLFLAPRGGPLRHKSFWSDAWVPACTKAGLVDPRPRPHDIRHAHASWLIAKGIPMPVIQRRLGHESITTTIDLYGHLSPDIQRAAADAADQSLTGLRMLTT
jgi:integrase